MPVTIRGSASANSGSVNTTSLSVTVPGAAQVGDVAVLVGNVGAGGGITMGATAGWTQQVRQAGPGSTNQLGVWTRTLAGGDAGSAVAVTASAGRQIVAGLVVLADADPALTLSGIAQGTAGAGTKTVPGITPTGDDAMVVGVVTVAGTISNTAVTFTPPTGWAEQADNASTYNGMRVAAAIFTLPLTGGAGQPTGDTLCATSTSTVGQAVTLAFNPVAVATPAQGAASGSTSWAGSAVGRKVMAGVAAGAIAWAGAASGTAPTVPVAQGASAGGTAWTGAASGASSRTGSSSGQTAWAGAATGSTLATGAASGQTTWTGAAAGTTAPAGVASGGTAWAGTAAGSAPTVGSKSGPASGATAWAGAASGQTTTVGTASGGIAWLGTTSGTAPAVGTASGSATGTTTWHGEASGSTNPAGAADGTTTWAGTATGTAPSIAPAQGDTAGLVAWVGKAKGSNGTTHPAKDITVTVGPTRLATFATVGAPVTTPPKVGPTTISPPVTIGAPATTWGVGPTHT